jgi:hypothetical protein
LTRVSPALLKLLAATTGEHTGRAGAPYRFGPAEGPAFFERHGWRVAEARSVFAAAMETGRVPGELVAFAGMPEPAWPFAADAIWSDVALREP